MLHEELAGLTEKLRVPLLLHYLEGKSKVEVAHFLGISESAVQQRLERGRVILEHRLTQRGITAGAAAITTLLEGSASQAAVSATLVRRTVEAVLACRAGTLSGETAELARQVLKSLPYGAGWLVKTCLVVLLCAGGLGAGAYVWRATTLPSPQTARDGPLAAKVKEDNSHRGSDEKTSQVRRDLYGDPLPPGALARLGTVRFRPTCIHIRSGSLAYTPDGNALFIGGNDFDDPPPQLWDVTTGVLLRQFGDPSKQTNDGVALLSPNGLLVATNIKDRVTRNRELIVWEIATGKVVHQLTDQQRSRALCYAFSPECLLLFRFGGSGTTQWSACQKWYVDTLEMTQKQPGDGGMG